MRATEFVASYMEAWNHHDPQAVADHLASDGFYRDVPENVQRTHDELIVSLTGFFSEYSHRYELLGEIVSNDETIAFQYKMSPTRKTQRNRAASPIRGAEFVTLNGDEALSIVDYYDSPGTGRPAQLAHATSAKGRRSKYAKSGLSHEQLLAYKDRLQQLMCMERAYLRPDLTLPRLAKTMDCSVNHLSQVINSGFDKSFFDYVNQFRIEHAKNLLCALNGQSAVLNIAFTVGFNSNSAFYAAFKRYVGQTPAQYRRAQAQDPQ